jgi:hypothetical protein
MEKIDLALQADEPLRAGLLRVADNLVKNAIERIRNPTSDRVEDLHFVRVTIKRLRAILRLIRPAIKKRLSTAKTSACGLPPGALYRPRRGCGQTTLATLPFAAERNGFRSGALAGLGKTARPRPI